MATTGAGARRVKVVGEFGKRWKGRKVVEEVEVGVLEPSTEGASHPPKPLVAIYFRKHVGKDHS